MNQSNHTKTTLMAAAMSGILVMGLGAGAASYADTHSVNGASSICKAASGPGASVFFFSAVGALNTSNSAQFLTCDVPMLGNTLSADANVINLHLDNPTAVARTFTCVVVVHHFGGTPDTSAVYNFNVAAGDNHFFESITSTSTPALPLRGSDSYYTLSCSIPAGTRMNSIRTDWPGTIAP